MAKQTFTTGQVLTAAQMTSLQQTAMGGGSTTAKTTSYTLVAADAGTVIQMNSASATTITVNTALFAAGDTVQIQNIGAGVCTVTAGTATVNTAGSLALSQYEGGQLYFNTTSAAFFFDVVQSSSASGLTLITRNTFSNIGSVAIDSIFSATYYSYMVVIESIYGATGTDDLHLQMRYGTTTQTANYQGACATMGISSVTLTSPQTGTTSEFTLGANVGTSTYPNAYTLYFNRVGQASQNPRFHGTGINADTGTSFWIGGYTTLSQTYTGILLKSSSSNITGVVSVYGLAAA